jgi:hypothetical protein
MAKRHRIPASRGISRSCRPHQGGEGGGITEDDPITLREACALFPRAHLTVSTLRAEARRDRLMIFPIGKRHYTTLRSMREMVSKCQQTDSRRQPISIRKNESTDRASALAAANETLRRLKSA